MEKMEIEAKLKKGGKKKKKKGFVEQIRGALGLTAPENSGWINFSKVDLKTGNVEKRGRLLMTVEIVPIDLANRRKCGDGREVRRRAGAKRQQERRTGGAKRRPYTTTAQ